MRAFGVVAIGALAAGACAQVTWVGARGGFDTLRDRGLLRPKPRQDPLEPSGFPGLPPKEGALPAPAQDDRRLRILNSGPVSRLGPKIVVEGPAHVQFGGYDIFAGRIEGDLDTEVFFLNGDVKLLGKDAVVTGGSVQVMFKEKTFRAENSDAQLRPSFVQGRTLDDVYLGGKLTHGSEREVFATGSYFTTCNLDHPHFTLDARSTVVRPGKRAILRNVELVILGHRVVRLPYLSIPLEDYSERYFPEVGQSRDEGYYVKSRTGVPLSSKSASLDARVDYYTKLGAGLGGDYRYDSGGTSGLIKLFGLTGQTGTLEFSNSHRQQFGNLSVDVNNAYQRNNYLSAPGNILLNSRANLTLKQGPSSTRFGLVRTSNESTGFSFEQQQFSLGDQRRWNQGLQTNLDLNLVSSRSEFTAGTPRARRQLDVRFRGQQDLRVATAELEYMRSIPVGETTNFFSSSDRTPVLTLKSTSEQLLGRGTGGFPFQTQLSVGEFVDARSRTNVSRGAFEFAFQRPDRSQNRHTLSLDGRFKQGIYSDDTAQYVVGMGANYRYNLGADTGINVRYNYLRPFGFSPLQIDRSGNYHQASMDLNFRPLRSLLLGAQTGYDLLDEANRTTPWQSLGVRAEYEPTSYLLMRAFSTYDPFQQGWSNVRIDLAYKPGATFVRASARYDGIRHTWGQVALSILDLKWGRLKASTDLVYNGYLLQFEARHFDFRYDLHCAEAVLQIIDNPIGFRSGREINFFFRLKAFPFDTPFGTGRRGQSIGGGTGRDF